MSGGYNPKVAHLYMSNNIPQMRSTEFQKPFFFGGSQVPINLELPIGSFSGSGLTDYRKEKGHYIRKPILPYQLRK